MTLEIQILFFLFSKVYSIGAYPLSPMHEYCITIMFFFLICLHCKMFFLLVTLVTENCNKIKQTVKKKNIRLFLFDQIFDYMYMTVAL